MEKIDHLMTILLVDADGYHALLYRALCSKPLRDMILLEIGCSGYCMPMGEVGKVDDKRAKILSP